MIFDMGQKNHEIQVCGKTKICDRLSIPKCDRHIYYDWICSIFGYGPANTDHPDAVLFDSPFVDSESNKLKSNGPKFKAKTLFPIPSGLTLN